MVEEIKEVHCKLDSVLLPDVPVFCYLRIEIGRWSTKACSPVFDVRWNGTEGISHQRERIRVEDLVRFLTSVARSTGHHEWSVISYVPRTDKAAHCAVIVTAIRKDSKRTGVSCREDIHG